MATVAGAGAGAYAGHEIEKRMKKTLRHDVVVRLEDGTARTFSYPTEPAFRTGDKVKIAQTKPYSKSVAFKVMEVIKK